ncbi:MAG: hypothetical protein PVG70_19300 [Desulfobacterales bacterium]
METNEAFEELKKFVLGNGLPKMDMALFGILCPYCGKSDRIRQLEEPDTLKGQIDSENIAMYTTLWKHLVRSNGRLGVCKFCQNLLLLVNNSSAVPLFE